MHDDDETARDEMRAAGLCLVYAVAGALLFWVGVAVWLLSWVLT